MADLIYRLGLYESMTVIPIASFNPGVYYVRLGTPAGNSLLSTLFVKSASGSVEVEYEDSGPGDGTLPGEIINLGGHTVFNTGAVSERIIITRISNKPRIKVTVLGGAVEFGVHISIVSDFPDSSQGVTQSYIGTVGTTPILVPSVAGKSINQVLVHCPTQSPASRRLYFSFNGVDYHVLSPGESISWPVLGGLKQLYLKSNAASVSYEVILNTSLGG